MDAGPLKFDIAWLWQPQVSGTSDRCSRRIITVVLHFAVSSRFSHYGCRLPFGGWVHWTLTKVLLASTASFPEETVVTYMTVSHCDHRELHATRLFLHLLALVYMRLCGRLAKKYLALLGSFELDGTTHLSPLWVNNQCCPVPVSTGCEQDAQFLSSHRGCLSTRCRPEGPDTYWCRPVLGLSWGVTLPVSGNVNLGLLMSTGPIFVYPLSSAV